MTPERFQTLLQAYGADPARWPESERAGAAALIAAGAPRELRAAVADAARLDARLDADKLAAADDALLARIFAGAQGIAGDATAPARRARAAGIAPWWRTARVWARTGLAVTGLAGALAGASVVSVALPDPSPALGGDWQKRATAFSEPAADWSDE